MHILDTHDEKFPSERELDSFVASHPHGSIFHTSKWLRLIEKQGYDPAHLVVSDDNGNVKLFLPLYLSPVPRTSAKVAHSIPESEMGGPLVASENELGEIGAALLKRMRSQALRKRILVYTMVTPEVELASRLFPSLTIESPAMYLRLDLKETPPQRIWDEVFTRDGRQRNNIRKMERDGVSVRLAERRDLKEYYSIYSKTVRDAGATPHSYAFLEEIWDSMWPQNFNLLLSTYRDEIVAGSGFLCYPEKSSLWMLLGGYRTGKGTRNTVNLFSWWQTILWAHQNGFNTVEMGTADPDEKDTVFRFKKQFHPLMSKKYFVRQPMIPSATLRLLREVRGLVGRFGK